MSSGIHTATMAEIAEKVGVSKATVSRALSGSSLIGIEVREQIEATAKTLGYVRRPVKRPGERAILTVKLILPPTNNRTSRLFYSFHDLVEGLRDGLSPSGVNLIVENGGPQFTPFPHKKGGDVEAFVFAFHRPTTKILNDIKKVGSRVVVLNRSVRGITHVLSDHDDAMSKIASHLAKFGVKKGCCFIGYRGIEDVVKARLMGFEKACVAEGIEFDPQNDSLILARPEELKAADLRKLFNQGFRTFVGVNDVIGSLLIQHAREAGLRIPTDVRVTGCDHSPIRSVTVPLLTTVDLSIHQLAKEAGRSIYLDLFEGEECEQAIFVKGTLLTGQST